MPEPEEIPVDPTLEERIRQRAYDLYVSRGGEHGADIDDWMRAEEEVRMSAEQEAEAGIDEDFTPVDFPAE